MEDQTLKARPNDYRIKTTHSTKTTITTTPTETATAVPATHTHRERARDAESFFVCCFLSFCLDRLDEAHNTFVQMLAYIGNVVTNTRLMDGVIFIYTYICAVHATERNSYTDNGATAVEMLFVCLYGSETHPPIPSTENENCKCAN